MDNWMKDMQAEQTIAGMDTLAKFLAEYHRSLMDHGLKEELANGLVLLYQQCLLANIQNGTKNAST